MMRTLTRIGIASFTGLALFAASASQAQAQGMFGFDVNGGYYMPMGDDFEEAANGFGAEATGRWAWPGGFSIGAGAGFATFGVTEDFEVDGVDQGFDVIRVYAAPRYAFPLQSSKVTPFLEGRIGYVDLTTSASDGAVSLDVGQSGFEAGGIGGVAIALSDEVSLDASVMWSYLSVGEGDIEVGGETLGTLEESSGSLLGFRAGLGFVFP